MRTFALALTLLLSALPAVAGGFSVDLPALTWPADDSTTLSTKGCDNATNAPAPQTKTAACE